MTKNIIRLLPCDMELKTDSEMIARLALRI